MSLATTNLVRPTSAPHPEIGPFAAPGDALSLVAPAAAPEPTPSAETASPRLRAVPAGTEPRGFVLYVGVDELKAAAAGTDLGHIVEALKKLTGELVPTAETYA
ncbi:MAG: hypothetical protein QOK46_1129, partial [Microbacteriaceae bacterium]|nr:hypothetical protein [Microbacteriaceae bacterium]